MPIKYAGDGNSLFLLAEEHKKRGSQPAKLFCHGRQPLGRRAALQAFVTRVVRQNLRIQIIYRVPARQFSHKVKSL